MKNKVVFSANKHYLAALDRVTTAIRELSEAVKVLNQTPIGSVRSTSAGNQDSQ